MKKLITLSFVFILCSNIIITSQDISGINQSENISEVESQEPAKNFEDLYLQQKDFNERILNTVYWALGSILFVLLAIVGSNIYYNYQFNKKKYDNLLEEHQKKFNEQEEALFNKIVKELDIVFKHLSEKNDEYKKEIDEQQKQDRKELGDDYKERLDSFSENLIGQIRTLKRNLGEFNESNEKAFEKINKGLIQLEVVTQKSINNKIKELKINIRGIEAENSISKGDYDLALIDYIQQAFLCIEIDQDWKLEYSLNDILKIIPKCDYFLHLHERKITRLLPLIPEKFSKLKTEISKAIAEHKSKQKEQ